MRRIIIKLQWTLLLSLVLLSGCDRDGIDREGLYGDAVFKPASDLKGYSGYGTVGLKWTLPDVYSSLQYLELNWSDQQKILTRFDDTLGIADLEAGDYMFYLNSYGLNGERATDSIKVNVIDWHLEPPMKAIVTGRVEDNAISLKWTHPEHRTYDRVRFDLYDAEYNWVKSDSVTKTAEAGFVFKDLKYASDYNVVYYSLSKLHIPSAPDTLAFSIGLQPPAVPEVIHDTRRMNYAYCADIKWQITEGMDSIRIEFTDLEGNWRTYVYGAAEDWNPENPVARQFSRPALEDGYGYGYLSMLPGGTTELSVSVLGTNKAWSKVEKQTITTAKGIDRYRMFVDNRMPNLATPHNKLGLAIFNVIVRNDEHLDEGKSDGYQYKYSQFLDSRLNSFTIIFKPIRCVELENLIYTKTIRIDLAGNENSLKVEDIINLARRMPKLETINVRKDAPFRLKLQEAWEKIKDDHTLFKGYREDGREIRCNLIIRN